MVQESPPTVPVDDVPELDAVAARLDELLGNHSEREVALVARLVGGFPVKASGLVERWSTATLTGEHEEAARAIHTLKGTALNLGSRTLPRACEEIESWSRAGGPDGEAEHRERLESAVAVLARGLAEAASARAIVD